MRSTLVPAIIVKAAVMKKVGPSGGKVVTLPANAFISFTSSIALQVGAVAQRVQH